MNKDKIRSKVVEHLKAKGNFEDVDDYNIDLLIDNLYFMNLMKQQVVEEGCVIDVTTGNGFTTRKLNPAFTAYQMSLRNVHQIASKLGISRRDRIALKLVQEKETKDELDAILNN
jgi:P27 family predicted phage terminase small subunit